MAYKLHLKRALRIGAAGIALTTASAAFAQNAPQQAPAPSATDQKDDAAKAKDDKDIVVTGTTIRGIAPAGANTRSVTKEQIELSGATDTQQILGTLPQTNTFMAFQNPGSGVAAGVARVPINLPNLRNLPQGSTGNPTTLVMMDGHRIVPSGIEQSAVDAGIVPSGIIERTEIILDGVSALYGSDASGGVINFITRKRFDGITAAARYGFADNYWAVDAELTAGTTWNGGGFGITYDFAKNSPLFNLNRAGRVSRNYLVTGNPLTGTACEDHSTITAAGQTFTANATTVAPTLANGASNCASNAFSSFLSAQQRHGALAVFSQDVTDKLKFEVTALYSYRTSEVYFGPFTATESVKSTNPYFRSLSVIGNPSIPNTTTQSVAFSYGPVLGTEANNAISASELWQVTPTLSLDVGKWQVRALAAYGQSTVIVRQPTIDTGLQTTMFAGLTTATTNNPYDMGSSTNIAQIESLVYTSFREGMHKFLNLRLTGDGPLFTLPAGEVKLAVGAEYMKTDFTQINTIAATHLQQAPLTASTAPKSVFGEVNIPLFSDENAIPGFQALTFSASGRYDDYQEFGTTFNPKLAATWSPFKGLSFRGNWGTSFRAPNAVNKIGGAGNSLSCQGATGTEAGCLPATFFQILPPGGPQPPAGTVGVVLIGSNDHLKPETSKNWSVGADIAPPFVPGLTFGATLYQIDVKDLIGIPSTGTNGRLDLIFAGAPQLVILNPTAADLAAAAALAPTNGQQILTTVAPFHVAYLVDTRTTNLGAEDVEGLDLNAGYVHPFGWGSIDASLNATWRLTDMSKFFANSVPVDALATGVSRFKSSATLGVRYGGFRGQITWQHASGFPVLASATRLVSQTDIGAFDLFNLALRYNVNSESPLLKGLQFTLTVNNIFDRQPITNLTTTGGIAGGDTFGRFVQFGISKSFGGPPAR